MEENKYNQKAQVLIIEEEEDLPGFRFHPTDEELVGFYLRRKVEKKAFSMDIIKEIDIYKYDPWDLPKVVSAGEKEWYFFCLRGRKYRNSIRPNRVTGSGFWKATGIDRPIYSSANPGDCIGLKKSLVYYKGSAGKGTKTDWMMHEFRLPCSNAGKNPNASMQEAEVWTICRIFKRAASYRNINRRSSTSNNEMPADSGSKTSSFESDGGNEYKLVLSAASYPDQGEMKCVGNGYAVHGNQLWSSNMAQAPPTVTAMQYYSNVEPNAGVNDHFLKLDEDWDELGRVVEFMTTDQNVASYCE